MNISYVSRKRVHSRKVAKMVKRVLMTHQCTMGPLQWEDDIRNFSFLRRNMTISRQNVTFTF